MDFKNVGLHWSFFLLFYSGNYRASHKECDYKDDTKFLNYDDLKIKLRLMPQIESLKDNSMISQKKKQFYKLQGIVNIMKQTV